LGLAAALFAACLDMVSSPELTAYFSAAAAACAVLWLLGPARRIINWLVVAVLGTLPLPLAMFVLAASIT
jgi:hypothetical protein